VANSNVPDVTMLAVAETVTLQQVPPPCLRTGTVMVSWSPGCSSYIGSTDSCKLPVAVTLTVVPCPSMADNDPDSTAQPGSSSATVMPFSGTLPSLITWIR